MTEAEWLTGSDIVAKTTFLQGRVSERKARLFAVACCRRAWWLLDDERSKYAVEEAERHADGLSTEEDLRAAYEAACDARHEISGFAYDAARCAAAEIGFASPRLSPPRKEDAAQCQLLHDIFGNVFRPVTLLPDSLSRTVRHLAESIYAERAFDRLPILADALEEVGCANAELLAHCRGPGPHVRGCWVVDLLTGRH